MNKIGKIIVQPMGGLANRMRVIGMLRMLAQTVDAPMEVLWVKNADVGAQWADIFDAPTDFIVKDTPQGGKYQHCYKSSRWYRNLWHHIWAFLHGYTWYPYNVIETMDSTEEDKKNLLQLWTEQLKEGRILYISTGDYLGTDYDISIFRPIKCLQHKIDSFLPKGKSIYGVHIRRTDNTWSTDNSPLELFEDKITEILKNEPDSFFYVASDEADVIKQLKNRFGECILSREKVFSRTSVSGIQDAIVEMWLLSKTKKIFGSYYSSYSTMSAKIGGVCVETLKIES